MSTLLEAALAAQAIFALVLVLFAIRAWNRVRDGRLGFLALAFILLLVHTAILLISALTETWTLESGLVYASFAELGAFLALYLGILRP